MWTRQKGSLGAPCLLSTTIEVKWNLQCPYFPEALLRLKFLAATSELETNSLQQQRQTVIIVVIRHGIFKDRKDQLITSCRNRLSCTWNGGNTLPLRFSHLDWHLSHLVSPRLSSRLVRSNPVSCQWSWTHSKHKSVPANGTRNSQHEKNTDKSLWGNNASENEFANWCQNVPMREGSVCVVGPCNVSLSSLQTFQWEWTFQLSFASVLGLPCNERKRLSFFSKLVIYSLVTHLALSRQAWTTQV